MRGKGRRAGGRGDALGNLEAHRRRSRCRPAPRPLHTARSISTTAARCLPRAPTYIYSYTSPTGHRRRAAAVPRAPARAPAARCLTIADQCLLLLGPGSELGVGFRAGGRAVNLRCKRLLSKEKIETCRALSKRGRPKTVVCREMMLPAHALLKQASSQGVIAARADFRVHVPRSAGACGRCGARGVDTVGPDASQNARVSQVGGVAHRTSSVASTGQPVGVRMCSGNAVRVLFRGHRARSPSRDAG